MNYTKIAKDILIQVGGRDNIHSLTHCFTRLRFVLKDQTKVNKKELEPIEGVISVVEAGGQLQVVCGAKVNAIYEALQKELGEEEASETSQSIGEEKNQPLGNRVLQTITQIFTPLIPAIAAAGLLKGILTAAKLIMVNYGVDITTTDTYTILFAVSQVIFYFFPIFLAMTSAKALKCNQVIAMVIAGTLCFPTIDAIVQDVSSVTTIFGLPVIKGAWQIGDSVKVFSYTESVIPILLAVLVMSYLEKGLKKAIPEILQLILIPGLELLIMIPITLSILGPIGIYIGNGIQVAYDFMIGISPTLGGALVGGLWGVFVIFGAHRALLPIGLNDVALNGHQNILAFAGSANFAQGGAALGVMLRSKDKEVKQVAASATLAATIVGVTEPAIYGCNLRLKKPMIYAIVAGAIGGGIMGFGGVYGDAFANNGVLTIFTYAAFGLRKFIFYLVGIGVAYFGAAALTYFFGGNERVKEEKEVGKDSKELGKIDWVEEVEVKAPMKGEVVALSSIRDEAFASGELGKGIAIIPAQGEVVAPADCVVSAIFPTNHAIGLELKNGAQLLIHIGINTVELGGQYFTPHVKEGDVLQEGDKVVSFDQEKIQQAGYDLTTPIVVTNEEEFTSLSFFEGEVSPLKDVIIRIMQ